MYQTSLEIHLHKRRRIKGSPLYESFKNYQRDTFIDIHNAMHVCHMHIMCICCIDDDE